MSDNKKIEERDVGDGEVTVKDTEIKNASSLKEGLKASENDDSDDNSWIKNQCFHPIDKSDPQSSIGISSDDNEDFEDLLNTTAVKNDKDSHNKGDMKCESNIIEILSRIESKLCDSDSNNRMSLKKLETTNNDIADRIKCLEENVGSIKSSLQNLLIKFDDTNNINTQSINIIKKKVSDEETEVSNLGTHIKGHLKFLKERIITLAALMDCDVNEFHDNKDKTEEPLEQSTANTINKEADDFTALLKNNVDPIKVSKEADVMYEFTQKIHKIMECIQEFNLSLEVYSRFKGLIKESDPSYSSIHFINDIMSLDGVILNELLQTKMNRVCRYLVFWEQGLIAFISALEQLNLIHLDLQDLYEFITKHSAYFDKGHLIPNEMFYNIGFIRFKDISSLIIQLQISIRRVMNFTEKAKVISSKKKQSFNDVKNDWGSIFNYITTFIKDALISKKFTIKLDLEKHTNYMKKFEKFSKYFVNVEYKWQKLQSKECGNMNNLMNLLQQIYSCYRLQHRTFNFGSLVPIAGVANFNNHGGKLFFFSKLPSFLL